MKRNIWIGIGVVVVVALAIVFFVTQTKKEQGEIKIGVILPLTGPLAPQGERNYKGMQIAVEEINQNKPIEVELIVQDSQTNPQAGVSAFNKLIRAEKVAAVTGGVGSSIVMACAPIAEQEKVVFLSSGATSPLITEAGENIFRLRLSGKLEVEAMAEEAIKTYKISKLAVIFVNTDYGAGNFEVFKKKYESVGGSIGYSEGYEQGTSDFRTVIAKLRQSHYDGVYLIGHSLEMAHFLRQAKELGFQDRIFSTIGIESPEVIKIAGNAAEGVIYTMQKFTPKTLKVAKKESLMKLQLKRFSTFLFYNISLLHSFS